jgi:hypothetical protein
VFLSCVNLSKPSCISVYRLLPCHCLLTCLCSHRRPSTNWKSLYRFPRLNLCVFFRVGSVGYEQYCCNRAVKSVISLRSVSCSSVSFYSSVFRKILNKSVQFTQKFHFGASQKSMVLTLWPQMVTICTTSLTHKNSAFCPHSVCMCFVCIWEQTAIISLYSINWLVSITETECLLRGTSWIFTYISSNYHNWSFSLILPHCKAQVMV